MKYDKYDNVRITTSKPWFDEDCKTTRNENYEKTETYFFTRSYQLDQISRKAKQKSYILKYQKTLQEN